MIHAHDLVNVTDNRPQRWTLVRLAVGAGRYDPLLFPYLLVSPIGGTSRWGTVKEAVAHVARVTGTDPSAPVVSCQRCGGAAQDPGGPARLAALARMAGPLDIDFRTRDVADDDD